MSLTYISIHICCYITYSDYNYIIYYLVKIVLMLVHVLFSMIAVFITFHFTDLINVDVNLVTSYVNLMYVMYSAMLACRLQYIMIK